MENLHNIIFIMSLALFVVIDSRCITKNKLKGNKLLGDGNGAEPPRLRHAAKRIYKFTDRKLETENKDRTVNDFEDGKRETSSKIDQQFGDILCSSCCTMKGDEKEKCILKYCADATDPCEAVISFETQDVNKPLTMKTEDLGIQSGDMK